MSDVNKNDKPLPDQGDSFPTISSAPSAKELGSKIGPYKLLSVLGEGGFGVVYLAEQVRPIKRRVALKVIKPGMDTKQVIARFEAERQALALLDHPHIAHVYNAGTTEAGRPYFVMEYVKGIHITEYCDKYKLSTEDRLKLFIPLCQAIQHAHQKGIIHRDIKPSNVLITLHDEKPIPKIIDFGVSKALNQRLTELTLFTEQGQFIGTPEYMSPEQAELTGLDIDTRSDIYSLGVLLYELLTGTTPFDGKDLRSKGYGEMQRIIREQDPVKPSTKLSTLGAKLADVAKHRSTSPEQLQKSVKGDLDWVVMKSLEKDRARRYGTAQALVEDIERHLNHEPVSAGSPGIIYRSQKFLRRHRTQMAVACFVFVIASISGVIIRQYWKSERNLSAAQEELRAKEKALAMQDAENALSTAQEHYAIGRYEEAMKALETLVENEHVGVQARLLRARLALYIDDKAVPIDDLLELAKEPNDMIASQAHFLLANVYLENRANDGETAREFERIATEHLQKAESLRPNSADAYFNHALLSETPFERIELLNKALKIRPGHLDSMRLRILTHYASYEYDEMGEDASVLIGIAPYKPAGYAFRAIARREQGFLESAIEDHNQAIELAPEESSFYDQRRKTYMRIGDFEKALKDAQKTIELAREERIYHFHALCAYVELGRFDEAQREYELIAAQDMGRGSYSQSSQSFEFPNLAWKYIFDTLAHGLEWHPPDQTPTGVPFSAMRIADEAYHHFEEQEARHLVSEAFSPSWSPDGRELAYSRGTIGYSTIEILDVETGAKRLLTYSAFDPAWSPDGQYIAFSRYRKVLPLPDSAVEKSVYLPSHEERTIMIMNADGTGRSRTLANGACPSWSQDSKHVYYYSDEEDQNLCYVSIEDQFPEPVRVIKSLGLHPRVSPDEEYAAWSAGSFMGDDLQIVQVSTGKVVARYEGNWPTWIPDSRKVIFHCLDPEGLAVYDLEKQKAVKLLNGYFMLSSWSPDATQLVFQTGRDVVWDLWITHIDIGTSIAKASEYLEEGRQEQDPSEGMVTPINKLPDSYLNIPQNMLVCGENFKKIYAAIKQYEKEKGELPDWLSDLVPDYLNNEVLFCPNDTKHQAEYSPDPNLPCSYSWEFSAKPVPPEWDDPSGKMLYRDWKTLQVKIYGDILPMVRCHHHGSYCLNLAFGGKIWWSSLVWEHMFDPDYSFSLKELQKDK